MHLLSEDEELLSPIGMNEIEKTLIHGVIAELQKRGLPCKCEIGFTITKRCKGAYAFFLTISLISGEMKNWSICSTL